MSRTWSDQQQAIFRWFASGTGNLTVRARAGTGKTTTIVEAIGHAPDSRILLCAFNKRIATELQSRLANPAAEAATLHSVGFACVRRYWERTRIDDNGARKEHLARRVSGDQAPDSMIKLVMKLHTLGREMAPLATDPEALKPLAYGHDCVPDDDWAQEGWDVGRICQLACDAMQLAASERPVATGIDFSDMLFLPVRNRWLRPRYDLVVVDECQDMNATQLLIARGVASGRIVVVGDDHQCQPPGTMVRTGPDTLVPIERLRPGDRVITFDRHGQVFVKSGTVTDVATRPYDGMMYTVRAAETASRCTDSHKWLVRWTNRTTALWCTYLMRSGGRYRIGQCQMFRKAPTATDGLCFGLSQRARTEDADAAWILKIHDNAGDALAYEQIVSAMYGLPEMVFRPPSNILHFTQRVIDKTYRALGDLTDRAIRCLSDHGRVLAFPIYSKANPYERRGRTTVFETQACNIVPGYMAVPVAPSNIKFGGRAERNRHAVTWATVDVSTEYYQGPVYSLNVATHHKYVADGLVTCNSIYGFRGADSAALDRLKTELQATELGLTTTYRCGHAIVALAAEIVPDFAAAPSNPEGLVTRIPCEKLPSAVQIGDFVLSRKNAPLASVALRILRAGKRCKIEGRDIGAGLRALAKKLATGKAKDSMPEFLAKLTAWEVKEVTRAEKSGDQNAETRIERVRDQAGTLRSLCEGLSGVAELQTRIDDLFADDNRPRVVCSSVHRAKGLEADRVFILADTLLREVPCKCGHWATAHTQGQGCEKCKGKCSHYAEDKARKVEEQNIEYVAITRAKHELVWVDGLP